ncbi:MAG: DegT/DnrJ/EryC1/StrS family aminotransferase [Chloroflexi bacterium]|nr:DegT/DnrJ/EryC1/StrS family aminotransferase [Chloroflexota bacterium]MCY3717373.1 DegT/DnrJ/EryC1/StrS family aminotransferase [Chloroflexota bacterium]MXX51895.1 DegT/DnrJ/EryC1/StrS family aminotransferase [Chloroflexota bacterium]MXX83379.1 DegT/DnrJ/EryC1/StrS family aminotransferase [Chloroflexota bacterium]MYA92091.1 DegT/DnrJ/EryC1/StrS family aminotransferase [Chloroflexota bacterium]
MSRKQAFTVPRSRAGQTHQALRGEIQAALEPLLYGDARVGYAARARLESAFAATVGAKHALAAHSGTVALFLALKACELGAGDEVITVGNSDISTTGAIHQCGARAVLCDVRAEDYTLDAGLVEALITERTRALLPVDIHGHPADVKALREIATRHDLRIIEDAALATGAQDYGLPLGAFADIAMFSFAPYKPLGSAGNGAMLVTDDATLAEKLRLLIGYGGSSALEGRQDYVAEGYNAPLDPLQAALLLVKLPHLATWTARRRQIVAALEAGLAGTAAQTPRFRSESSPTFRSYCIRVPEQERVHRGLRTAGIEAVIHYAPPVYRYTVYTEAFKGRARLPVTDRLAKEIVNLPVTPELSDTQVEYMIEQTRGLL